MIVRVLGFGVRLIAGVAIVAVFVLAAIAACLLVVPCAIAHYTAVGINKLL